MPPSPVSGSGLLGEDRMLTTPDARQLHTMLRGDGDDLVVLEAGLGMSGLYWGPVHELISDAARVIAYERAGFGFSSADPAPRTLEHLADDLENVIDAFPHRRLVLVGHSWGGPIVRTVAARRLADARPVTGVVLVDPTDEHAELYFSKSSRIMFSMQAALSVPLARAKLLAPMTRPALRGLPAALRDAALESSCSPSGARATAAELRLVTQELRRIRDAPPTLGNTPVRVITGRAARKGEQRVRTALNRAHQDSAEALENGRLIPAERSGHMVPLTEPALIAAQVTDLLR